MNTELHCPTPRRPCKRAFINTDFESPNSNKRARYSSCLPSSPSHEKLLVNSHILLNARSDSTPPWPAYTSEREKNCPSISIDSPIEAWLSAVNTAGSSSNLQSSNRSRSCPAIVTVDKVEWTRPSLGEINQMAQRQRQIQSGTNMVSSSGGSQSSRLNTSKSIYRSALLTNGITMDCSGKQMPVELKNFASTQILKQRKSPQLSDQAVLEVIDTAEELSDNVEGPTANLINSSMFPLKRSGVAQGGNSPWNTVALPNDPDSPYKLSIPRPDAHFGYSVHQKSDWSNAEYKTICHPAALSHTMPTRSNTFPFLMVEMKSEAAGGTIYVAENQAAGSGSHSVNALLWLLREAGTYDETSLTDRISFTIAMSHRQAVFYLHWYSVADRRHYMSFLNSYSSFSERDIRACNNTVKNIIDFGLGARRAAIGSALKALFPFPEHWQQARSFSDANSAVISEASSLASSTHATSLTEEGNARPNKRSRLPAR